MKFVNWKLRTIWKKWNVIDRKYVWKDVTVSHCHMRPSKIQIVSCIRCSETNSINYMRLIGPVTDVKPTFFRQFPYLLGIIKNHFNFLFTKIMQIARATKGNDVRYDVFIYKIQERVRGKRISLIWIQSHYYYV